MVQIFASNMCKIHSSVTYIKKKNSVTKTNSLSKEKIGKHVCFPIKTHVIKFCT